MIAVDILGPHFHLEVRGRSLHYTPFKPCEEMNTWLVQHCHHPYIVTDLVEMSYEQGVGEIAMFCGLKFIFENHDDAMLFKLTWA